MRKLHSFWRCLDERADTASPRERWRRAAGSDFDVLERFLVPNGDALSPVFPCPECGRDLVVIPLGDVIVAEPDEGAPCRPLECLTGEDVREHMLNWPGIVRALAAATGCPLGIEDVSGGGVCAGGDWVDSFGRLEVVARFGVNDQAVSEEALRLMKAQVGSLLLTGRHRRTFEGLLAGPPCGYAALEDVIEVDDDGRLGCGRDLLARAGRPSVCRETLSVVKRLEWVFADEGASYRIVIPEGEFTIPKQAGSTYLYWFVRNPRADKRALAIIAEVRGTGVRKVAGEWAEDEVEPRPSLGCDDVDGMTTRDSLRRLYERLRAIKSERDRAEDQGDHVAVTELNQEVAGIEAQIDKDTNRFGKIRKSSNDDLRAERTITRAVDRCYEALRKAAGPRAAREAFIAHFKDRLKIGYMCRYEIPMERDWGTVNRR